MAAGIKREFHIAHRLVRSRFFARLNLNRVKPDRRIVPLPPEEVQKNGIVPLRRREGERVTGPFGVQRNIARRIEPGPVARGASVDDLADHRNRQITQFHWFGTFRVKTERIRLAGRHGDVRRAQNAGFPLRIVVTDALRAVDFGRAVKNGGDVAAVRILTRRGIPELRPVNSAEFKTAVVHQIFRKSENRKSKKRGKKKLHLTSLSSHCFRSTNSAPSGRAIFRHIIPR